MKPNSAFLFFAGLVLGLGLVLQGCAQTQEMRKETKTCNFKEPIWSEMDKTRVTCISELENAGYEIIDIAQSTSTNADLLGRSITTGTVIGEKFVPVP